MIIRAIFIKFNHFNVPSNSARPYLSRPPSPIPISLLALDIDETLRDPISAAKAVHPLVRLASELLRFSQEPLLNNPKTDKFARSAYDMFILSQPIT